MTFKKGDRVKLKGWDGDFYVFRMYFIPRNGGRHFMTLSASPCRRRRMKNVFGEYFKLVSLTRRQV